MHTLPTLSPPLATFLQRLALEEQFLVAAVEKGDEVYAALRRGDMGSVHALAADQERLAADLRAASAARLEVTSELAAALDLDPQQITLAALADRLPEPDAGAVRAARGRLALLAADLNRIQTRNANLLGHLRSFFRDVLADIGADGTPTRYGPSGQWLPRSPSPPPRRGTST